MEGTDTYRVRVYHADGTAYPELQPGGRHNGPAIAAEDLVDFLKDLLHRRDVSVINIGKTWLTDGPPRIIE